MRILFSPYPHQYLLFLVFLIIAFLHVGRDTVILICIFLMIHESEHLFMCLVVVCRSYLKKKVYSDPLLKTGLFDFLLLSFMSSSYILDINP